MFEKLTYSIQKHHFYMHMTKFKYLGTTVKTKKCHHEVKIKLEEYVLPFSSEFFIFPPI
jgi:hypothetical protein